MPPGRGRCREERGRKQTRRPAKRPRRAGEPHRRTGKRGEGARRQRGTPRRRIDDPAARLTIAAEALRAAVERGAPYQAELAAVQVARRRPECHGAARAVCRERRAERRRAGARTRRARAGACSAHPTPAPSDATFLGRLEANAQKLVRVTPVDAPAGNDPAVGRRADRRSTPRTPTSPRRSPTLPRLPDAAKPLAADWVKKAQARDAAIAASRRNCRRRARGAQQAGRAMIRVVLLSDRGRAAVASASPGSPTGRAMSSSPGRACASKPR